MITRTVFALVLGFAAAPSSRAEEPRKLTVDELQGTWLFDAASRAKGSDALGMVWNAKVVVKDNSIAVEKFLDLKKPLRGTVELDPAGKVGHIDLKLEEYDLKEVAPAKISAGTLAGVYRWTGDKLALAFHAEPGGARPKSVDEVGLKLLSMTLVKALKGFAEFPKSYTLKVTGSDGQPAKGVSIGHFMSKQRDEAVKGSVETWSMFKPKKTDERGALEIDFSDEGFQRLIIAWDEANGLIGFGSASPAELVRKPEVAIELKPICKVKLNLACDELKKSGATDHFHCYAETKSGRRIAFDSNTSGQLDFLLPAGDFKLHLYGSEYVGSKHETLTVPKDRSEFDAPKMTLPPTALLSLLGKPAPALADVKGWKGDAVKLADLKGKVVLLEFWGYWCGPCIASMPVLFDLHEKFADTGLAIVGIHLDADGEVDTAAKLDAKIAGFKKEVWKGKDLPFPVALTSGHRDDDAEGRGGVAGTYGIRGYPSTILIDRDGKVVGKFQARDSKLAIEMMEKLLKESKK